MQKKGSIKMKSVSIIFPAFNEKERIRDTILEASNYFTSRGITHEIIVSADGTDGTREQAQLLTATIKNLIVIGNSDRKGKGFGVRKGVEIATCDVVGYADADNKTPITEFDKFIPHFLAGAPVVIGVRDFKNSETAKTRRWYRRLGSYVFNRVVKTATGLQDVAELQCGFKFFQTPVAKSIFAAQRIDSYMFDTEILSLAAKSGLPIAQVSVIWKDDKDSRLKLFSGNLRNILDILGICWRLYGFGNDGGARAFKCSVPSQIP
jgi:dolichyl-phosphate beta-glucosyltransferase